MKINTDGILTNKVKIENMKIENTLLNEKEAISRKALAPNLHFKYMH